MESRREQVGMEGQAYPRVTMSWENGGLWSTGSRVAGGGEAVGVRGREEEKLQILTEVNSDSASSSFCFNSGVPCPPTPRPTNLETDTK